MFKLSFKLGRTVNELLNTMSSVELAEYMAYWTMDPQGEERADYRNAIVAWAAVAPHCKHPPSLSNFLPRYGEEEKMTTEQVEAAFRALSKVNTSG